MFNMFNFNFRENRLGPGLVVQLQTSASSVQLMLPLDKAMSFAFNMFKATSGRIVSARGSWFSGKLRLPQPRSAVRAVKVARVLLNMINSAPCSLSHTVSTQHVHFAFNLASVGLNPDSRFVRAE